MSYIVGHPIKNPQDFYGRLQQKKRFFEIISGPQAQSITILGTRRSGKTSFLRHVANPEVMAQYLKEPDKYIMVYIDVSACRTPSEFYQRTIAKLNKLLPAVQPVNLWAEPEQDNTTMFHLESVLCQFPDKRIILLLDEFDKIRKGAFDQDFLTELRALASVWEYELACITASFSDLYQLGADVGLPPTSPFYNIFYPTPIYMDGVSIENLQTLITTPAQKLGVQLTKQEIEQIVEFSGTLPFFAQAIASAWVHEHRAGKINEIPELFKHLLANLSSYFAQWWRHFSDVEREVLKTVASRQTIETIPHSTAEISEATHWLKSFAFLSEKEGELMPNGRIFSFWLNHLPGKSVKRIIRDRANLPTNEEQTMTLEEDEQKTTDLLPIYQKIVTHFNLQDLSMICFELGVDEECLTFNNKQEFAKELLLQLQREGRLPQLLNACKRLRPNLTWQMNMQQMLES